LELLSGESNSQIFGFKNLDYYFLAGDALGFAVAAGEAATLAFAFAVPALTLAAALGAGTTGVAGGAVVGAAVAAGDACGDGAASAPAFCKTERVPEIDGNARIKAHNIKRAVAPIVILASKVCVPRGPKAVLETLLEKSAPASDFPGCKRTTMISTTQARMNRPYKT
jgi:hypothetical protein